MPFIKTLSGTLVNTDLITSIDLNDADDGINMVCTIHLVNKNSIQFTGDVDATQEAFDLIENKLKRAKIQSW